MTRTAAARARDAWMRSYTSESGGGPPADVHARAGPAREGLRHPPAAEVELFDAGPAGGGQRESYREIAGARAVGIGDRATELEPPGPRTDHTRDRRGRIDGHRRDP